MRVREIMRRSCAVTAMAALVMHHVGPMLNIRAAEPANESGVTGQRTQQKGKKDCPLWSMALITLVSKKNMQ